MYLQTAFLYKRILTSSAIYVYITRYTFVPYNEKNITAKNGLIGIGHIHSIKYEGGQYFYCTPIYAQAPT